MNLISRDDAIAIAKYSKDPVEGIKHLPAVDAVEVKHGRWIWDADNDRYICSNCNNEPLGDCYGGCVSHLSDYCPNCGARMDGE